jgi:hypothetical protein
MNYYFKNKYVDVNVNEAKLKDIPVPALKKNDQRVSKIVSMVKKKPLGIFQNDEINSSIYELFEVPSSVKKQVEEYYKTIDDADSEVA